MHSDFTHAAEKLEFGQVLEMIAAFARGDRSKALLRALAPIESTEEAERSRREIRELAAFEEAGEAVPLGGWQDTYSLLDLAKAEGHLYAGAELAAIAAGEAKAAEASVFLERCRAEIPLVSERGGAFRIRREFIRRVERAIGRDFEVLDEASPKLARLRGEASSLRAELRRRLAEYAGRAGGGKGYEFVTIRGERYVVSLPRGEAGRVRGVVHQASGSGASLFVEPLEFVDGNNRLESILEDERGEVTRILLELSSEVFAERDAFLGNQDVLRDLDCASAKAQFARRFRCTAPEHGRGAALALVGARHPLLEKRFAEEGTGRAARPLDVRCGEDLRILVISGPNAGGKTVALKTIGLIVVMDRAGLLVPCAEGSTVPRYDDVFVDIGDDQSIEASLSTFSSRVACLRGIVERANERSLVLIDEIGDGTDPEEGAALAQAVLEHLMSRCGRVIVTTHLTSLKGWAHDTAGAMNATLEFDPASLEPLFVLRMGVPGRSWGIETAGRLGLPPGIIERARSMIGAEALHLEELLAHLEKAERFAEAERRELVRKEGILSGLIESYRDHLDRIEQDRDDLLTRSRREALDIVTSARRDMETLIREIRTAQAGPSAVRGAHELVAERRRHLERSLAAAKKRPPAAPLPGGDIRPGEWALIGSLGKDGKVLSAGESRVVLELEGGLRVETGRADLFRSDRTGKKRAGPSVSWSMEPREEVSAEISVRGLERAEALERVDVFLDRAVLQGLETVVIIHGIGKGILKRALYDMLRKDPRIAAVRPGEPSRGGDGVVVVDLK